MWTCAGRRATEHLVRVGAIRNRLDLSSVAALWHRNPTSLLVGIKPQHSLELRLSLLIGILLELLTGLLLSGAALLELLSQVGLLLL